MNGVESASASRTEQPYALANVLGCLQRRSPSAGQSVALASIAIAGLPPGNLAAQAADHEYMTRMAASLQTLAVRCPEVDVHGSGLSLTPVRDSPELLRMGASHVRALAFRVCGTTTAMLLRLHVSQPCPAT